MLCNTSDDEPGSFLRGSGLDHSQFTASKKA
jgi:hypothetical protein